MSKIRVLIADDHALVREGIAAFLKLCDDIEVVCEASDGIEVIERAHKFKPDIILMDIGMPKLGGLEATVELRKSAPNIKIIVLTQYDDREYISRFLKAGVSGYMLKKAVGSELVNAIRAVNRGEFYLFSSIASEVVDGYLGKHRKSVEEEDLYEKLTDREKQVLKLIAEGHSHKEIASLLNISAKTVIAHQTNISEKLDMHSRTALVKFAISKGIIKLET
ncbi:MAG: DNA-binding response regulator [Nitrospirae bacterium RBG_19FT_COMBO_55_12]|nr:MAG: DNA-binding response regulator [Nitrospirae bacterium RBG_19FT_COMBO_55_12]